MIFTQAEQHQRPRRYSRIHSLLLGTSFLLASQAACGEKENEQCKKVCAQEAECAESMTSANENYPYSVEECVAACIALERDSAGKQLVKRHIECVDSKHGDCAAILSCR